MFKQAIRKQLHARVALWGPSGSGKTTAALTIASALGGPIGLIDTEYGAALALAPAEGEEPTPTGPFNFSHFEWTSQFDPRVLADQIAVAAAELGEDGVLIIDSLSHFWAGDGGTLEIVDRATAAASKPGKQASSYSSGWSVGTPAQNRLVEAILAAPCHVIVTMRAKQEYVLDEKFRPQKVGLGPIQRDTLEYEFESVLEVDMMHTITVRKARHGCQGEVIEDVPGFAADMATWLGSGAAMATPEQIDSILEILGEADDVRAAKNKFLARWGQPKSLTAADAAQAIEWIGENAEELGL